MRVFWGLPSDGRALIKLGYSCNIIRQDFHESVQNIRKIYSGKQ